MPTRDSTTRGKGGGRTSAVSAHLHNDDNDSDDSGDTDDGFYRFRRYQNDGRGEGGRGELKQLQDSLTAFFTPSNRRRSRVAQGSISLEQLDREVQAAQPSMDAHKNSFQNESGDEKPSASALVKKPRRRRKTADSIIASQQLRPDHLRPLTVIIDEPKLEDGHAGYYNTQPSCSSSKTGMSSPSSQRKSDGLHDALSPYFSASSEKRHSYSKGEYAQLSGRRRRLRTDDSSPSQDQMPALSRMVDNKTPNSAGHSTSESRDEAPTAEMLADENSDWAASSSHFTGLIRTSKPTQSETRQRRRGSSFSAASPRSISHQNISTTSVESTFRPMFSRRGRVRRGQSSMRYRMRGTHPNLRSSAASRNQESAASLVRRAKNRRLRTTKLISTAIQPTRGRRPGRKPRSAAVGTTARPTSIVPNASSTARDFDDEFGSPTRMLLKNRFTNGQLSGLTDLDRNLFNAARRKVREDLASQCHVGGASSADSVPQPSRHPKFIRIGQFEIETWYSSPYPEEYARLDTLFLCEFCLKYMKSEMTEQRHYKKCEYRTPPGNEIYRKDSISVFEVDGNMSRIYCQNVCLLAKLFLDHKTLYYDVEPFLFYVVTKSDECGCHFVGYFSKEKYSAQRYNLSCIMTLPAYQRQGFGRFLIDFSFLLTRRENMLGTPERPLSDLGQISYRSYWQSAICEHIHETLSVNQNKKITIKSIARGTGISASDIVETLGGLEMLERVDSQQMLIINWSLIENHWRKAKADKTRIWIDESRLLWSPKVYTPSKDYGIRSPSSARSRPSISPLKSPTSCGIFSPHSRGLQNQRIDSEAFKREPSAKPKRKLFPSVEQKIRKNARKGRPPASASVLKRPGHLRTSSSVNYREYGNDESTEEEVAKGILPSSRSTCKSDVQQSVRLRRKSSDDDSPDGRHTQERRRGRKASRRGLRRHLVDVKDKTSSLLSGKDNRRKNARSAPIPAARQKTSSDSDSSDDSEEPLSKHLLKKRVGRKTIAQKVGADIAERSAVPTRSRKPVAPQRKLGKVRRSTVKEFTSGRESSSSDESADTVAMRISEKPRDDSSLEMLRSDSRKRKKGDDTENGSLHGFRRKRSLSTSSASLSSSESSSGHAPETPKEHEKLSRSSSVISRCTERAVSSRTLVEEVQNTENYSKSNFENGGVSSETGVVNMGGAPSDEGSVSGGEEERKSLTQCGAEIYGDREGELSPAFTTDKSVAPEPNFGAGSVPMMEVSTEFNKVQESEEQKYPYELPPSLNGMPQLRVADNVENAYDDEDAPPCLSPNFAPTEMTDEDSRNGSDDPAPLLLEGAAPVVYEPETTAEQVSTSAPQINSRFSSTPEQPSKPPTIMSSGCEMVNIGGEAASDDEMDGLEEQNADSSGHSASLTHSACDPSMMRPELSEFDRPLGAPRPADDHENQNAAFEAQPYQKSDNDAPCEPYDAKQMHNYNEMLCEQQVPTHSPAVSSSSGAINNMVSPQFMPSSVCAVQQHTPGSASSCLTPQQPTEMCTASPNTFIGSVKGGGSGSAASTPHGPGSQHSQQMMGGEQRSAFMSPPMSKPVEDIRLHNQGTPRMPTMNEQVRTDKPVAVAPPQVQHQSNRRSTKKEQNRPGKLSVGASSSQRASMETVLPAIAPYVLPTPRPQQPMPHHFPQVAPSQAAQYYGGYPQAIPPTPFESQFYSYPSTAYPTTGYGHMQQVAKTHPASAAMQNTFSYYPSSMPQGRNMSIPNGSLPAENIASPHNMMGVQCPPLQNPPTNAAPWRYSNPSTATFTGGGFMEAAFGRTMATSGNNAQFPPQLYPQTGCYPCIMPMMRPES